MKNIVFAAVLAPLVVTLVAGAAVARTLAAVIGTLTPAPAAGPAPIPVPLAMLRLYGAAAATCPGLSWTVPAAIGTVESDNGLSGAPGVHSGANPAGAEGPMQFEPATFAAYAKPLPAGGASPVSPYDPTDAVFAAVRMLCRDGAAQPASLAQAIWDYNHSAPYVSQVMSLAIGYGYPLAGGTGRGQAAVDFALAQLGTPYGWGGETIGKAFDCSGLAQASWAAAGVVIPRVAQAQFDAGPGVPAGAGLAPGDLVFFGSGPADVTHVGVVVSPRGVMVDAPHTGAVVRVESFPMQPGAKWGGDIYLGATDPGGGRPTLDEHGGGAGR